MSLLERSHILIIWILLSLCVAEFNMQMCPPSTRNGLCQLQSEIPNFNLSQAKIRVRRSTFKSSEPFSEKNKKQSKWMRNHNPPLTPLAAVIPFLSIKLDIHNGQISGLISDRGTINSPRSGSQPDNPLTDANSFGSRNIAVNDFCTTFYCIFRKGAILRSVCFPLFRKHFHRLRQWSLSHQSDWNKPNVQLCCMSCKLPKGCRLSSM